MSIWGAVIMFSEQYNSHGTLGTEYIGKTEYRKIFEAMALLRFIGLICFGCVCCMFCCILIPLIAARNSEQRRSGMQQRAQQLQNVPVIGFMANNFID